MVVDEAVQVNEPLTVAPLSRLAEGGRVVLVGDPLQLGCHCMSTGAGEAGLETSLYERLGDVFVIKMFVRDTISYTSFHQRVAEQWILFESVA